jgi:pimeloyl-ACP methyl ester carboxylesterase
MTGTPETVSVPHLGGSTISYKFGRPYDPSLPTLVMINSFTTSMELYRAQYADSELVDAMNLLAIEPYGHGGTRATWQQFTYWDSAIADLQVLEALGIPEAFVLGTSQGGWIAARMAMLAPDKVKGIIVLGTSMDDESQRSRDLGCWDGDEFCTPTIDEFSAPVGDDWVITDDYVAKLLQSGLGDTVTPEAHAFWLNTYRANYTGDAGRKRILVSAVNLRDRDGLHARLNSVLCPVLWLHGSEDSVYSIANAREEIAMFNNSPSAELRVVDGGQHFLSASNPQDVDRATIEFVDRWHSEATPKADALIATAR